MNQYIDVSALIMISIFSFVIFESVENVNNAAHVLEMIDVTLDDIEDIKGAPTLDETGKDIPIENHNITFEHVNFSYEKKQVINNVDLTIDAKTTTAIIGPSGSGNRLYVITVKIL
ncbi:ABC transporter ATP-binding protein [Staphylococcus aureus]|uniref:ABC transporter ATP-binding protein n=1 Tax=Staphylococcus aureus TaxID=1280 RepID=A0A380DMT0_STAAU|nr:ABC transporter ATP-binding protein [Staphylococcus aureus]